MTTLANHATDRLLRNVLLLDAASGLLMGLPLMFASAPLAGLTGLDAMLLFAAGAALLPVALLMQQAARRLDRALVLLVIVGNLGWVAASFALLALVPGLTPLGTAFVVGQALAVAGLATLEAVLLRRL